MKKNIIRIIAALCLLGIALSVGCIASGNTIGAVLKAIFSEDQSTGQSGLSESELAQPTSQIIERGRYLARIGNCMPCHTAKGSDVYAGGREFKTAFGALYSPNITSDVSTGLGAWSATDFWKAIHLGRSKNGHLMYPAFPYTNYTKITRRDADALYLYFKTVPAVVRVNQSHDLQFPYNQRFLLNIWRALYFRPGVFEAQPQFDEQWNRGAYLVQGLGHCSACHTARNRLGATNEQSDLAGGLMPTLDWYAPSLTGSAHLGLGEWTSQDVFDLLKTGVSKRGSVFGPMSEVVSESLQYMNDQDTRAMVTYLKALPETPEQLQQASQDWRFPPVPAHDKARLLTLGSQLYQKYCIECHQAGGKGMAPHYPPLVANRSITMYSAVNAIRMVLNGGYPPSTQGNPRPYGMPPFRHQLSDDEVAAVVSYVLSAWGNNAEPVSAEEVGRYRSIPD
ncbi:MAG: cytochrome c [Pseudomonadota bacterium]